MPLKPSNGAPGLPTQELLAWIVGVCEAAERDHRKLANATGFAINSPDVLAAKVPQAGAGRAAPVVSDDAWIKITAATQDSTNFRWTYTAKIVTPPTSAFGTWTEGDEVTAYNTIEHANDADDADVQSGINLGTTGITGIAAVHTGAPLRATRHVFSNGDVAYLFAYPNAPVIDCEEA